MVKGVPKVSFFDFVLRAFEIVKNPLPFHHKHFEEKGETFLLHLGFQKRILFSRDPAFLKYTLQTNQRNYTKSEVQTRDVAKYLGKGLLTSEGELWKKQRKLIQPTFHKKQLDGLLEGMRATIKEELATIPLGKRIDIEPYFGRLACKVVANSRVSGAVEEKTIARLQCILESSQRMLVRELRQPYLGWWFKLSGVLKKHMDWVTEARGLVRELIHERQQATQRHGDLLDLLLDARYEDGGPMDEEQMIDEILILFTAGHETTSNALTFSCQLLARHPEYQAKIRKESTQSENEGIMMFLQGQKIVKYVIEESMRMYPPAFFIDRMNLEADAYCGIEYPKDTAVLFSVIEIHRHKAYWKDPETFRPERFEGPQKTYSDYYFPFGAGPRMCIGNNFAMFEMQLVISELLKGLRIQPEEGPIEILPMITLKPEDAYMVFEKIEA